ncbi:sensor histidine kinase [Sunxiuqinia sp. sy24]|uniref:sensor histidine kinase n=1 Tax=Sunxiuqinia sp. sy24 TaxID=3461495 RepID=UPI0040458FCF
MFFKQIHSLLSFNRLLKLLVGIAIGIQLIVISYNHFSGYYVLTGYPHFFQRLLRGSLLSLLAAFLIAYPDLYIIDFLNKRLSWGKSPFRRTTIQLGLSLVVAGSISVLVTLFANWLNAYTEYLPGVLLYNALIYSVVNLFLMAILEAWISFIESSRAKHLAEHLQEELSQIKFEVLKSQINPHFLFNSLNVLSGLVSVDSAKAQLFIDEFSHIYRYVLETIEQPVVTLNKELDFMRSYLFLQQIRYGDSLTYEVTISVELLQQVLPPLSLQVVLENAIKHNIVNEIKPLKIELFSEDNFLVVKNNIQLKTAGTSTGLGLKNLEKRYALISKLAPQSMVVNNHYIAKLPLINPD